jgi:hypothetical protein
LNDCGDADEECDVVLFALADGGGGGNIAMGMAGAKMR